MLGADARLLTEGEEIKSHDLFQRLTSKETITGENEEEESELKFLKVIRDVRDHQPDLFARIKRLPRKARTAKHQPDASRNTLLTYFRKGKLEKFFLSDDLTAKAHELDFIQTAKLLQCEPETPHASVGADFYTLLDRNKESFVIATTEESDDEPITGGSHDNSQKILTRLRAKEIKRFQGFTDEDESFMRDCLRLLEDGALPKPTTKKVWEAIRNEVNPLKILSLLKRDVPAEFFQTTRTTQVKQSTSAREVILSAYLINE